MINAFSFIDQLRGLGYSQYAGVPCSFLTPLINYVIDDPTLNYVGAASEGEAVGITFGAFLAGRKTVTMCQNSGLGNMVNPLTSLNYPFRVPTLLIVTWRGQPEVKDEPQHEQMGKIMHRLLDTLFAFSRQRIGNCQNDGAGRDKHGETKAAVRIGYAKRIGHAASFVGSP
jgi:phosphonopyruvate decarboxylase